METEQAAERAQLELRRLYGRQAEAFTWTLPLGPGPGVTDPLEPGETAARPSDHDRAAPGGLPVCRRRRSRWPGSADRHGTCWAGRFASIRGTCTAEAMLTNPNLIVLGQVGRGKSTFVKTFIWRQVAFGRQAWIVDPKGEYGPLAEACGATPCAWRRGASVRLNPLDLAAGPPDRPPVRQPPSPRAADRTPRAGQVRCRLRSPGRPSPDRAGLLADHLVAGSAALAPGADGGRPGRPGAGGPGRRTHPPRSGRRPCSTPIRSWPPTVRTDAAGLAHDGRLVALELRRLVEGDLAGMFDGPTSPGLRPGRAGRGPRSVGGVRVAGPAAPDDLRDRLAAGDPGRRPRAASVWWSSMRRGRSCTTWPRRAGCRPRSSWPGRWASPTWRSCTGCRICGRPGPAGSAQQRLAEGLLADTETRVVFGQAAVRGGGQPPAACA